MVKEKGFEDFNFGNRLKTLIEQKGITMSQFYKETETPYQRMYDWQRGSYPSVVTAYKLALYFGITVEELIIGKKLSNPLEPVVANLQNRLANIQKMAI